MKKQFVSVGLLLVCAAFFFSSCKGSSSAAGVTSPSTTTSSVSGISGTVMGGLSPIQNANIQLFQAGNSTPIGQAVTSTNGTFLIPGTISSTGLYYLMVTNGNAGSGTNNQIQLMAIVGAGGALRFPTLGSMR